jgi:hypothetical protein
MGVFVGDVAKDEVTQPWISSLVMVIFAKSTEKPIQYFPPSTRVCKFGHIGNLLHNLHNLSILTMFP